MSFADILALSNWERVYLIEIEVGHQIDGDVWIQCGAPNTNVWYISHPEGDPSRVEEDSVAYVEKASVILCQATASTWFWDVATQRLYIHTSGSDDPAGGSYDILSFFWEYYTNMQFTDEPVIYSDHYYLPYLNSDNMPDISMEVSDYSSGGIRTSYGTIKMINADGRWDTRLSTYIYEFKRTIIKACKKGSNVGDMGILIDSFIGDISLDDQSVEFSLTDPREQ